MGIVSSLLSKSTNNMKFLLVIAVAAYAKAEAEAKPGFAYSIGHLPLAYAHAAPALTYAVPHVNPVVYALPLPAAGCQNSEGAFFPVLKDPTSDTYLLLLLLPRLKLLLLLKLKGRREKLRLSPQLWLRLKLRLTLRPTHGYTIAVYMVDISAMVDTPTTDL